MEDPTINRMTLNDPQIQETAELYQFVYHLEPEAKGRSAEFTLVCEIETNAVDAISNPVIKSIIDTQLFIVQDAKLTFTVSKARLKNYEGERLRFRYSANLQVWKDSGGSSKVTTKFFPENQTSSPATLSTPAEKELLNPPQGLALHAFAALSPQQKLLATGYWIAIVFILSFSVYIAFHSDDLRQIMLYAITPIIAVVYGLYDRYLRLIRSPVKVLFKNRFRPEPKKSYPLCEFFEFMSAVPIPKATIRIIACRMECYLVDGETTVEQPTKPIVLFEKCIESVLPKKAVRMIEKVDFTPAFETLGKPFEFENVAVKVVWQTHLICENQVNQVFTAPLY